METLTRYQKRRAESEKLKATIIALYDNGAGPKQSEIAKRYRISKQRVYQIVNEKPRS